MLLWVHNWNLGLGALFNELYHMQLYDAYMHTKLNNHAYLFLWTNSQLSCHSFINTLIFNYLLILCLQNWILKLKLG